VALADGGRHLARVLATGDAEWFDLDTDNSAAADAYTDVMQIALNDSGDRAAYWVNSGAFGF
jgi:hypothetical protein